MINILGGGPAGSTCAYYLAKNGFDVNLYEKSPNKRKPCGGGLSWRIFDQFPEIINNIKIPLRPVKKVRIIYKDKPRIIKFDRPIGFISDRLIFDRQLRTLAKKHGCHVTKKMAHIDDFENGIIIDARGFYPCERRGLLITSICKLKNTEFTLAYYEKFNRVGYFWIFPMSDKLASIGVGEADQRFFKLLPSAFEWWVDKLNAKAKERRIWQESLEINPNIFEIMNNKLVIKIGERAGLVDPLTGEGIYYAMKSGKLLADSIITGDFSKYIWFLNDIRRRFFVYRMTRLFILKFPEKTYSLLKNIQFKKLQSFFFRFY